MTAISRLAARRYLLLPLGAGAALVWANTMAVSYFTVAHRLSFAVNDVGMALLLALAASEAVETAPRRISGGDWRLLVLAVIAAVGGIAGAGLVYIGYLRLGDEVSLLAAGWPIACATDVAFVCFIATRICPPPASGLLVLLAIVSNGIGLLVLELRYPIADLHAAGAPLVIAALVAAAVMRRCGVRSCWPYLVGCGGLSWYGLFLIGLHPALALLPIVPFLDASRFRQQWSVPAQVVLFMFALTNGGVILRGVGTGTWAVTLAAVAGRPAGTLIALAVAAAAGLRLPRSIGWRDMIVVSATSAVGFTFGLFFATVTFPLGPVLNEVKLGALMTIGLSLPALAAGRALHAGRFARPADRQLVQQLARAV
jgi:NhaA family Na+:H+ antiporter